MNSAAEVLYEVRGAVAVITINRPDQLNAINNAVCEQLTAALRRFDADDALRVAILTAAGNRAFSAGRDLKEVADGAKRPPIPVIGETVEVNKPVIAAVNGPAAGGGFAVALASDVRIAATSAKFNAAFIRIGLSACDIGTSWVLPRLVGAARAQELMLTGRVYNAQDGERVGLSQYVVPMGQALTKALELATRIASNAPMTNFALMHALPRIAEQPADHGFFTEALISSIAQSAPEAKARVRAFLEGKAAKVQKN